MLKLTLRQFNRFKSIYNITNAAIPICISTRCIHTSKIPHITSRCQKPIEDVEEAERDYLVRLQNDPDVFGSDPALAKQVDEFDLDAMEERFISNERQKGKRLTTKQYADMIKALIAKKKIKEAIDIVEVRMLQVDRVKPESYLYNLLLGACGRVGYTKKAFSLYNDIKRRGLKIHPGTYTALFNACANSPWAEDGLTRTKHLHNIMIEKRYEPNDSNYNAMIKAYGRWGEISTAFSLVDEMVAKKFAISDATLNFLMQACISDKEVGFRHALLVWRKFIARNIKPTIFSYNLMLRATRDCGLGDLNATNDVLKRILPKSDRFLQLGAGIGEQKYDEETDEYTIENVNFVGACEEIPGGKFEVDALNSHGNRPNLLAPIAHLGDVIQLDEITKPEDRLLLLGGAQGFLDDMLTNECKPNIKTFTQLLDCLPSTITAEKELLAAMKKNHVRADLDFYNMLIKKRSMRFDYAGARDVLELIKKEGFLPDLITYGVLALGCRNREEAESFLFEMQLAKYRLNAEILGAMLQQSCYHFDFSYVLFVMEQCVSANISPNEKFMEHLSKFYLKSKKISNDSTNSLGKTKQFLKGYQIFKMRYKTWKENVTPEEKVHPWQQYRQPVDTDVRHYKNTADRSIRFKARHKTLFRRKAVPTEKVTENEKPRFRKRKTKSNKPNQLQTDNH